jgi:hypothetical protein
VEIGTPATDERLRRIEAVTDSALAHLDVQSLLVELLGRVRELLLADTAAVLLLDHPAAQLVATAARGLEEEVRQGVRLPVGKGFAGRIAAERRPVRLERVDHRTVLNPVLREEGIRSLLGVPMLAAGEVIGVMHVGSVTPRRFTDEDVKLLQMVADRAALATQARQAGIERAATLALQRGLMPARLPGHPALELAARYVPGPGAGVGGDWFDVFPLHGGRLGVVIGDVVGRGLTAAVVMGRLRSALRAYALDSDDPAAVLARLDQMTLQFEPETMATALYAVVEASGERMRISLAGHPAPVLAVAGGPARLLSLPVDVPLGTFENQTRRSGTVELPRGSLTFFYTDGLVERRDRPIDVGLDRLCDAVVAGPPEAVCAGVMGALVGGGDPPADDIAILAMLRRTRIRRS